MSQGLRRCVRGRKRITQRFAEEQRFAKKRKGRNVSRFEEMCKRKNYAEVRRRSRDSQRRGKEEMCQGLRRCVRGRKRITRIFVVEVSQSKNLK
ncbi:hypothetical protein ERX46_03910 [Brumimicrobium glaciale]|uniref:Uncharacterized protein n=1 Tax=Brumimicrobium glaciale TaxID=200475 RepID=A0A4Q4KN17_9FLAO|nr:hypothetical protein [Brumimicrobium glaciale]RYM34528.1 hypothetical protein ERX46_03910 [Brumimicrobium glaciale]